MRVSATEKHGQQGGRLYAHDVILDLMRGGNCPPCPPLDLPLRIDSTEMQDDANRGEQISDVREDEGAQNLDLMLSVMEEKDKLKQDVLTLGNPFI